MQEQFLIVTNLWKTFLVLILSKLSSFQLSSEKIRFLFMIEITNLSTKYKLK